MDLTPSSLGPKFSAIAGENETYRSTVTLGQKVVISDKRFQTFGEAFDHSYKMSKDYVDEASKKL
jgi:hypothetical protein